MPQTPAEQQQHQISSPPSRPPERARKQPMPSRWKKTATTATSLPPPKARKNLTAAFNAEHDASWTAAKQKARKARAALSQLDSVYMPIMGGPGSELVVEVVKSALERYANSEHLVSDNVLDTRAYWPWKELHRFFRATLDEMDALIHKFHMGRVDITRLFNLGEAMIQGAEAAEEQLDSHDKLDCTVSSEWCLCTCCGFIDGYCSMN